MSSRFLVLVLIWLLCCGPAAAHELRPAYLDLREIAPDRFAVLWKVPAVGQMRLALELRLPDECTPETEPVGSLEGSAHIERWTVACPGGLKGKTIHIDGLDSTMTDVLAHIAYAGGTTEIARIKADSPFFSVRGQQTALEVARTYFVLGVEHILGGFDHLLFVLALIILIGNFGRLVKTVTAFTAAHSITLAGAALGYFSLAQKPVEAVIALSIAFVASEILKTDPSQPRLSERYPWIVAFTFGLLHGFGFAGALKEIGLPQTDVPLALLTFNVGVEAGQLMFIMAVLLSLAGVKRVFWKIPDFSRGMAAYGIGIVATVWLLSRLWAFGG